MRLTRELTNPVSGLDASLPETGDQSIRMPLKVGHAMLAKMKSRRAAGGFTLRNPSVFQKEPTLQDLRRRLGAGSTSGAQPFLRWADLRKF